MICLCHGAGEDIGGWQSTAGQTQIRRQKQPQLDATVVAGCKMLSNTECVNECQQMFLVVTSRRDSPC